MTTQTTFALDEIDAALAAAGPSLDHDKQRLTAAVLRLLSAGHPASIPAAAAAAGIPAPRPHDRARQGTCGTHCPRPEHLPAREDRPDTQTGGTRDDLLRTAACLLPGHPGLRTGYHPHWADPGQYRRVSRDLLAGACRDALAEIVDVHVAHRDLRGVDAPIAPK